MKRYLLFTGWDDMPADGWKDFHSDHEDVDSARSAAFDEALFGLLRSHGSRWYEVVDIEAGAIVDQGEGIAAPVKNDA